MLSMREQGVEVDDFSPGTVAVYTDHVARFSDFIVSLRALEVPKGSVFSYSKGVYLAYNTNRFIREMEGDWLFLMDDDHRFEPDILLRLLALDVDVAVALTSKKFPPYAPVLYRDGEAIDLQGESGVIEVDACGKPGMLIKRHVLEDMEDPWCEYDDTQEGAEDMNFCGKIKAAGYTIHADLDNQLAHLVPIAVYKQLDPNGNWGTMLALGDNGVFLPDTVNG